MNALADGFQSHVSHHLPAFLSHLWSSTIFLALALFVVYALRKRITAGTRFTIVLIGMAKFAIPATAVMNSLGALREMILPTQAPAQLEVPLRMLTGPFTLASKTPQEGLVLPIAAAASILISLILIARFTLSRQRLIALSVRTALPPDRREVEALARARRRAGVGRSIDLARSPIPEAPAVLRTFRPVIILPITGCDDLSDAELESILCHECAHVARHDNVLARLEHVVCALFWFHPLIWIAQRIAATERERACDEVVSASAEQRDTYLAAIAKFCHAAIAPRLPGVSCMATSKLKERMDHVMGYPEFRTRALSPRRVGLVAAASLLAFTAASGLVGAGKASGDSPKELKGPYSVKVTAERSGESVTIRGSVSEAGTAKLISEPSIVVAAGEKATTRSTNGDTEVVFDAAPAGNDAFLIEVRISRNGELVQTGRFAVVVDNKDEKSRPAENPRFTGEPIDLSLKNANLRDVIKTFGQLTMLDMRLESDIEGVVTVEWHNVPWDQAFDELMKEHGLTYRTEGSVVHIQKK
ncbi:MAG: hypothetical protein HYU52_07750 [Acidobacteria bacterium]|nr:hypothetical protein [Acidobacteriota bacterium]